ncbi:ABC transporter permease [Paraflavitalea pollutisoli]|uniref:ABC transporter permease n=1 Tax=Paraflavitalea pollutisoli TaxID=3034143 RepID=UPI0023EDEDBF|nr:ABC transporter permease [Paraflavitalea sp. H1-2-19X]
MIRNYFKVAIRNLTRNKTLGFINVAGLAVGMSVALLIGLWIYDETTYDKVHDNYDRIAKVRQHIRANGAVRTAKEIPFPLGQVLRTQYSNYFKQVVMSSHRGGHVLSTGDKQFSQFGVYLSAEAPEMLSLHMISGTREGLRDPASILLSQSAARAFFGDADPLNQLMKIDNREGVKVTGVYEDLPANATLTNLKFIAPFDLYVQTNPWIKNNVHNWSVNPVQAYVQLQDGVDMDKASSVIAGLSIQQAGAALQQQQPVLFLEPMSRWRLYAEFENGVNTGGKIRYVWMFGIIGLFVLLLACINFMNLSTARSERRAREVGVRKAVGSLRGSIIGQFYFEALLVTFMAFTGALLLAQGLLPFFNTVAAKQLSMPWQSPFFWLAGLAFCGLTALLAGSYPALYLSSFRAVQVLKGTYRAGKMATLPRKVSVVVQFTVSVALIICTIVVMQQIEFARSRPIGYNQDGLLVMPAMAGDNKAVYDRMREELKQQQVVADMAGSQAPTTDIWGTEADLQWPGRDPQVPVDFPVTGVSVDYGKTIGWQVMAGRDFSRDFTTDTNTFIINEAAVQYMGLKEPVGSIITLEGRPFTIVGVIKNVVTESPYDPVKPALYFRWDGRVNYSFARIHPSISASAAIDRIKTVFNKNYPAAPFEYQFVDQDYGRKFGNEERVGNLAGFFTLLAILISCMGLFALATFVAEQRTKEIGVRKVLGATVWSVWRMLTHEFVWLVGIALLIAIPVAALLMHQWLQNYQYRTGISWWIFFATSGAAIVITLLTVSWQAIKAARANPVKSLRTE